VTPTTPALDDYLATTLRLEAGLARITADFREALSESQEDEVLIRQAIVELESALSPFVEEAVKTLSKLAPPPNAEAYHSGLVNAFDDLKTYAEDVSAALEPGSVIIFSPVISDFTKMAIDFDDVTLKGQSLVITALDSATNDRVSTYLVAATEDRVEMFRALDDSGDELDKLQESGDTSGAQAAVLEKLIRNLEDLRDRWQKLTPPSQAKELHQRHGELIDKVIAVERLIHTAVKDDDQSVLAEASEKSTETSILRDRLEADWDDLLIQTLSR
jgi:hypothetical protein